jgi:predicted Ser/Thr protein kinase
MSLEPLRIGRYKVMRELGQGAMGVVYLAEDPLLKRRVAIKVVHGGDAAQGEALRRFRMEAEISARLNHPNVITIFDVGEEPTLGPFLAMEYVDGKSLSDCLASGPLDPETSVLLLIQALQALEAAHASGIIHRDFKPGNLMVASDGRLKLMDFGIAREALEDATTELLCTPSYAAPELMDRQFPSATTDRWAFVVTAFRTVLGDLPFQAPSLSSLVKAIDQEPPQFPEGTSPAIRAVFERALSKPPHLRYPDLRSFLVDLLEALQLKEEARTRCRALLEAGELPSRIGTLLLPRSARNPWLRLPRLLALGTGLAILVALGIWGWPRLFPRRISLQSFPAGANVYVDGRWVGTTPLKDAKIIRTARVLRLEKHGYQTLEHALQAGDHVLSLNLMPEALRLELKTEPTGAEVLLDGVLAGVTPLSGLEVSGGGSHRLMIRKQGYEPWSMSVSRERRPPTLVRLKKIPPEKEKPSLWKRIFGR